MKYLLDTHVFLWTIADTSKLPARVKTVITNPENDVFVSAVSFWEISIKYRLGKLELGGLQPEDMPGFARQMEFQTIDLGADEASGYHKLKEQTHADPFDRMLIWQAIERNLTLISKDQKFAAFKEFGLQLFW